jgi:hypothetical protein
VKIDMGSVNFLAKFLPKFLARACALVLSLAACTVMTQKQGAEARCTPPEGVSGSPESIEDAVELINALPKPVSVACFVQALDRPLKIYATNSVFSRQPAVGDRSPRIFIFSDQLLISIATDGAGSSLVEFGQLTSDQTSLKGELQLPVTQNLTGTEAFERIRLQNGTSCAACHSGETLSNLVTATEAFESRAIKPSPATQVDLTQLKEEYSDCNSSREPIRCSLLKAVFGFGAVQFQDFPDSMRTFSP